VYPDPMGMSMGRDLALLGARSAAELCHLSGETVPVMLLSRCTCHIFLDYSV